MTDYSKYLGESADSGEKGRNPEPSLGVPLEFVIWAYRLFLDREPEDMVLAERMAGAASSSRQVREVFLNAPEYARKAGAAGRSSSLSAKLDIERISDRPALRSFFEHVKQTWTALGETEPHWSVLSGDRFRQASLAAHLQEFRDSGRNEVERLVGILDRKGIALPAQGTCMEYGCGVGRVTRWLSQRFARIVACDISGSHIELARKYLAEEGRTNIEFRLIDSMESIEGLPKTDFFYSVIVLQHNPPPIIEIIVAALANSLNPGGYGFFQVPAHCDGYSFSVEQYLARLKNPAAERRIEMHVLQIDRTFRLVFDAGCVVADVLEDDFAGPGFRSFSYLIHRPR